ncbi:MAG TPA: Ku protein [Candidatus Acidoferrum sp.]|jgi:DNA end-binding protein Ku|nr:Ku protein [Candidatus Acidoferrum sp.]
MAASVWKGMISFGLVTIPIRLFAAARTKRTYLHQIHNACNTRLKQPLYCPTCDRMVDRSEVIKGYEYETGQYVLVDGEEIKKITPPSGRTMEIITFLEQSDVDPIYFDSSFVALPEAHAEKPYLLLLKALQDTKKMGVAKVSMHQREYTIFIRARNNGLTLHTMYYQNEIAAVDGYGKKYDIKLKPDEVKLADQLVENLSAPFKSEAYKDEFQERLNQLIEAKLKGKTVTAAPTTGKAPVIDMMQALKKSLATRQSSKGPKIAAAGTPRQQRKVG